jgi:hypothetical protein
LGCMVMMAAMMFMMPGAIPASRAVRGFVLREGPGSHFRRAQPQSVEDDRHAGQAHGGRSDDR